MSCKNIPGCKSKHLWTHKKSGIFYPWKEGQRPRIPLFSLLPTEFWWKGNFLSLPSTSGISSLFFLPLFLSTLIQSFFPRWCLLLCIRKQLFFFPATSNFFFLSLSLIVGGHLCHLPRKEMWYRCILFRVHAKVLRTNGCCVHFVQSRYGTVSLHSS